VGSRRNRRRVKQEHPLMRIYIIGSDGITLCRKVPATLNDGEIAVARMRSCRLPRSAPSGCWRCGTLCPVSKSERGYKKGRAAPSLP